MRQTASVTSPAIKGRVGTAWPVDFTEENNDMHWHFELSGPEQVTDSQIAVLPHGCGVAPQSLLRHISPTPRHHCSPERGLNPTQPNNAGKLHFADRLQTTLGTGTLNVPQLFV